MSFLPSTLLLLLPSHVLFFPVSFLDIFTVSLSQPSSFLSLVLFFLFRIFISNHGMRRHWVRSAPDLYSVFLSSTHTNTQTHILTHTVLLSLLLLLKGSIPFLRHSARSSYWLVTERTHVWWKMSARRFLNLLTPLYLYMWMYVSACTTSRLFG